MYSNPATWLTESYTASVFLSAFFATVHKIIEMLICGVQNDNSHLQSRYNIFLLPIVTNYFPSMDEIASQANVIWLDLYHEKKQRKNKEANKLITTRINVHYLYVKMSVLSRDTIIT